MSVSSFLQYSQGNSASTTISSGISNTDTSVPLVSDTNFSAKSGEGMVIIDEGTANEEFAYATTKTGGALTTPLVNRGLEGGSAKTHASGATVKGVLTATMWNNLIDALALIIDKTTGAIKASISFTTPTLVTPLVKTAYSNGNLGATPTIDWSKGDLQTGTLSANCTYDFSNAVAGQRLTFFALENGTGTYTQAFTPTIIWQDATTPEWTTTANKWNVFVIMYTGSEYLGMGAKFV